MAPFKRYAASLSIEVGQLVSLLGPTGAGKTTAIMLLLGLASPSSGHATVFGRGPRQRLARELTVETWTEADPPTEHERQVLPAMALRTRKSPPS